MASGLSTRPTTTAKRAGCLPFKRRPTSVAVIIFGLLSAVLALAVPLLPVVVNEPTLTWPGAGDVTSVDAPLAAYVPVDLEVSIPCDAATGSLGNRLVLATIPPATAEAQKYGLIVASRAADAAGPPRLEIRLRNIAVLTAPFDRLAGPDCQITVTSTAAQTHTEVSGAPGVSAPILDGDYRPQMVGVFTDLAGTPPAGLNLTARVDDRFSSTPSPVKLAAMILCVVFALLTLVMVHRLDRLDRRRTRRLLPRRWRRVGLLDAVVVGVLLLWHVIGANTADDGYQLGMVRASEPAGYMVNYFRYFGVPETPFGTPYYDIFGLFTQVSMASIWVRLPALLLGVATWWLISRHVLPRLGARVGSWRVPTWTAGMVFLAFWLPYNNGLRPEPAVAFGVLATWYLMERAIATRHLLPACVAILAAAFTLTVGPSGLICFAALLAASRPVVHNLRVTAARVGALPVLAALLASGLVVLVAVFADQPLSSVPPMMHAHDVAGPSLPWFEEYLRYQYLLQDTVDGSPTRRFGVFILVTALVVVTAVLLRRAGRLPGVASGPAVRLLGSTAGAMVVMMFTPTKWTHHFGVFAGLTASMAALLAVAVSVRVMHSRRNHALVIAAVSFVMALALTSRNGYWYVSSWGVPWFDKAPSIDGYGVSTVFRAITVIALIAALWFHIHDTRPAPAPTGQRRRWMQASPVALAAALMVTFEVLSMTKAVVAQYPAYSVGRSNLDTLAGRPCGLANDVLVETDPNASMLTPLQGDSATALSTAGSTGFTPNGVATNLTSDEDADTTGTANAVSSPDNTTAATNSAGTAGGRGATGINGSSVALPFGLAPSSTPVLGSFGAAGPATLATGWYQLPARDTGPADGFLAVAAAGRIKSVDSDGIVTYGQDVEIEYGSAGANGNIAAMGRITPIDIGPTPSWRNLRVPMSAIPDEASVVRIVARDTDLDPDQWVAITPPRMPRTEVLNTLIGSQTPVMIDWAVGLNFPCQHPLTLRDGLVQVPQYRILPDRRGARTTNLWQDHYGGGPLGWIDLLMSAQTLPTYLANDLSRDWGQLEKYLPRHRGTQTPELNTTHSTRSGLWSPAPIRTN